MEPTEAGLERAVEEVKKNAREQGCLCGDEVEVVFAKTEVDGQPTLMISLGHFPLCPLGQALFG